MGDLGKSAHASHAHVPITSAELAVLIALTHRTRAIADNDHTIMSNDTARSLKSMAVGVGLLRACDEARNAPGVSRLTPDGQLALTRCDTITPCPTTPMRAI